MPDASEPEGSEFVRLVLELRPDEYDYLSEVGRRLSVTEERAAVIVIETLLRLNMLIPWAGAQSLPQTVAGPPGTGTSSAIKARRRIGSDKYTLLGGLFFLIGMIIAAIYILWK